MTLKHVLTVAGVGLALLIPAQARAWRVGTQLDYKGCHEPITAEALRQVRAELATAPPLRPTADEAALFADVQFTPPDGAVGDLATMSLLLGVRDNDLKGQDPLSSLDLIQVHGNPLTQDEHCIRSADEDGDAGIIAGLESCRTFIVTRASEALAGLDAAGTVDPDARMPLQVFVSVAGEVSPPLPVFYVKMGQAMHALEDGFTHTYRTADGIAVTTMLNWIELADGTIDEDRDGPPHRMELDDCSADDPVIVRNVALATQAARELLHTALDPTLSRDQKVTAFQTVTARYLTFQPGCEMSNNWCDAPEAAVTAPGALGCDATGGGQTAGLALIVVLVLAMMRRRRRAAATVAVVVCAVMIARAPAPARADNPAPATPAPATPPTATPPVTTATAETPAVVTPPTKPGDRQDAAEGKEPGRDEKTPTIAEVQSVRQDKRLGSKFGFAVALGASFDRGAAVGAIGGRYRITEKWIVGLDAAWNPWITTAPLKMRAGVVEVYATGIRRWPMKYDRVNLRTSIHVGTSTLLFDVYGAPKRSTGLYLAATVLGIDYDLGNSLRLVIDPGEMAVAIPHLSGLPLWYEQFRFMVGLQYGS